MNYFKKPKSFKKKGVSMNIGWGPHL